MGLINFFKRQFWRPTTKIFPRSINQIFVGRSLNNFLFWMTMVLNIVWWIINLKEVQIVLNQIKVNFGSIFFGDYYYNLSVNNQIFVVVSFLFLISICLKIFFFIVYYIYYKTKPISIEESMGVDSELKLDNKEFVQAKQRLDTINKQQDMSSGISSDETKHVGKKPKNNRKKQSTNKGSSLKKLN